MPASSFNHNPTEITSSGPASLGASSPLETAELVVG